MRRPDVLAPLFTDVKTLRGVGDRVAAALAKLLRHRGDAERPLPRIKDLLFHLPVSVIDRRASPPLSQAPFGQVATFEVTVGKHEVPPRSNRRVPYKVHCFNDSGSIILTFFHARGDYLKRQLPEGQRRVISGRVERFGRDVQMPHPDYITTPERKADLMRLEPVYPLTAGVSNKQLTKLMREALGKLPQLPEWCDAAFVRQKQWPLWHEAMRAMHRPTSVQAVEAGAGQGRPAYDELLANQLALALARRHVRIGKGQVMPEPGELYRQAEAALPFTLTAGQQAVLRDIQTDMASGGRMLRLLQGDVGSGKTAVALMAMAQVVEAGKQVALMAPTEILARQHMQFFEALLTPLGISVCLLTGKTGTQKERDALRARIAAGEVNVVIGTHALFSESVAFADLALVVVDEQHRFGVQQRMKLAEKAVTPPHILLMTATPIPRTLTMTAFGDMDVSSLKEKPAGRQPIATRTVPLTRIDDVVAGVQRTIAEGNKVYWICPLVEESEDAPASERDELAAAEARYKQFRHVFGDRVGLAHGRMDVGERDAVMQGFAGDKHDILVATTVVEVGVNVPEATVMVIEHAERFGLSQLHQLRGRVGRGSKASSCILLYKAPLGEVSRQRLDTMRQSEDGFFIAEEDMRLRGAGDVLGTRQSGMPDFHFADLSRDVDLVLAARDDVKLVLHRDPQLQSERGQALRVLLYLFEYDYNIRYLKSG